MAGMKMWTQETIRRTTSVSSILRRFLACFPLIRAMMRFRDLEKSRLSWVKAEPSTPPTMPRMMAGMTAITFTAIKSLGINLGLNSPKSPLYLNPWKAELRRSVVNVATMQQKKTCHESLFFQKEETSSIANKRPPTGAPKAEAIPAAAPAEMKFLRSSEFLNLEKNGNVHSNVATKIWFIFTFPT